MTENSPQSICRSADGGEIGDNKENKSMSVPDRICDLMELATGGGSSASAFGGMGRGEAVEREKGAPGTELTAWKRGGMAGVWVDDWGKFEPERAWWTERGGGKGGGGKRAPGLALME